MNTNQSNTGGKYKGFSFSLIPNGLDVDQWLYFKPMLWDLSQQTPDIWGSGEQGVQEEKDDWAAGMCDKKIICFYVYWKISLTFSQF